MLFTAPRPVCARSLCSPDFLTLLSAQRWATAHLQSAAAGHYMALIDAGAKPEQARKQAYEGYSQLWELHVGQFNDAEAART